METFLKKCIQPFFTFLNLVLNLCTNKVGNTGSIKSFVAIHCTKHKHSLQDLEAFEFHSTPLWCFPLFSMFLILFVKCYQNTFSCLATLTMLYMICELLYSITSHSFYSSYSFQNNLLISLFKSLLFIVLIYILHHTIW